VHARRAEQAAALAAHAGVEAGRFPPAAASWDVLVNTTPVGTAPATDDTPMAGLPLDGALVYDLVYNPPATRLLRDAAAAGCRTIGGLAMLVAQAEAQFAWWTGQRPAAGVMREAALRRLATMEEETRPV
jgi:shikimate 5-dehydrogenase